MIFQDIFLIFSKYDYFLLFFGFLGRREKFLGFSVFLIFYLFFTLNVIRFKC